MNRRDRIINGLNKLTKEQLVHILTEFYELDIKASDVLIKESKWEMDSKVAICELRELFCEYFNKWNPQDEHIGDLADCEMELISKEELRRRILGD